MIATLLRLVATQPQLAVDHAEAYAGLVAAEAQAASASWRKRLLWAAVSLCCAGVACVLAGVAAMLWAALPLAHMPTPWALIGVPLVPALGAWVAGLASHSASQHPSFSQLQRQLSADVALLRTRGQAGPP